MDPYKILGVAENADEKSIKAAYRKLSRRYHPDMLRDEDKEGAKALLNEVQQAYKLLMDSERRAYYNQHKRDRESMNPARVNEHLVEALGVGLKGSRAAILDGARQHLSVVLNRVNNDKRLFEGDIAALTRARSRVYKEGDGENLLHSIADNAIEERRNALVQVEIEINTIKEAFKRLAEYKETSVEAGVNQMVVTPGSLYQAFRG